MSGCPVDVSVILVSYNTCEMTLDCLDALHAGLAGLRAEVWLVDNASTDDTAAAVAERFASVRLIANERNAGFGAANNQAMSRAAGRYFLLLNTDAFVERGTVDRLMEYMDRNPEIAAAGPHLVNGDGSHQASAHRFDTPGRAFAQCSGLARLRGGGGVALPHESGRQPADVYLKGACLMVRRTVYERIGGFDERFFFYGDEADWEKRMIDQGWRLGLVARTKVRHLVGTSGRSQRLRFTLHYYAARDQYILKHHGLAGLMVYRAGVLLWCLRKLAEQAWWRVRPGRQTNPFAIAVHRFLLRGLLQRPSDLVHRIDQAQEVPARDPIVASPAA